ncbi:MAG: undecaprenyl-diphosphate phosphatase [Marinobacter sp.]
MDFLQALWLGIIQGITEFLPISSSAHLILVPAFTGWTDQGVAFDLAVHLGTLLAVMLYFHRDVRDLVRDGIASLAARRFIGQGLLATYLILGTTPAALAGLLLLDLIDNQLRSIGIIFFTTLVFGVLLGWADWRPNKNRQLQSLRWTDALMIGMAQAVSLIPGTSRSGATITAGLLLGLNRQAASRFSFLLAIPITGLAASAKILEVATSDGVFYWRAFLVGGLSSFVVALIAIHFFLKWLNRFGMWPYVAYRLALAAVIYFLFLN